MRQRFRAVGLLAVAIVAITCTDAPTSPNKAKPGSSGAARVSMSPSFSAEAARIYSGMAAFGFEVTEVHIVLTSPDGSKKDTVIAFPASQDQITIEIPVPSSGTDQPFDALVELRNDKHVVLFSGHQTVIARGANLPPQTPPLVIINYTGPGKSTKAVTFSPPDTTIAGTATVVIRAAGVDSAGLPVPNLLVKFAVSDATLAVATSTGDATGTLTGLGKRGVATVSAITPLGVGGSSRITFVPAAARVVVISGNGQTGIAGSALAQALVVEVQATDNLPVPGATVAFRSVTAGGSVQQATVTADVNGRASSTLTLGKFAGVYVYEASSGTLPTVSVSATATPAPATAIAIVSGDAQTDTIGRTLALPFVVKVTDQFGGAVGGAAVTWTKIAGNGTPSASSTTTASDGTTSITYTLGAAVSNDTVRASVAGVTATVLFSARTVSRGPAAIAIVSGGGQSGPPNSALPTPLVARVADAQNLPIANATVTWSASGAGATLNPLALTTNALGQATTQATLGTTPGATTVTATVGTLSATTTLTTTTTGAQNTLSIFGGNQQTALAGTALPIAPSVLLKDGSGNPIANLQVIFAVATGGGTITGATATTNSSGIATLGSWTLGGTPGPNTLTATVGSLSVTFSATGTAPTTATKILLTTQPSGTAVNGASFATQPVVQLADANGNPVSTSGIVITAALANGPTTPTPVLSNATATTNSNGQATFAGMSIFGPFGNYTLSFSAANLTAAFSNAIAIGAGPANTIQIFGGNGQNALVGTAVAVPPLAKVVDTQGNGVPGIVVTFNAVNAGSTISNGTTTGTSVAVTTNAQGVAQLAAWTMSSTAGPHTLTASAPVPNGSPITLTANAIAAGGSKFLFVQPPPTQINVAVAIPPIQVQIADANGNPVSQAGVAVTLTGNVQPSGQGFSISSTTNAQGIVTLQPTPYTGTVGTLILSITGTGYSPLTSSPIQVLAGPASGLSVTTQPSATAQSGVVLAQQPVVQVVDAGQNVVATAGIPVTASLAGGNLSGTTVINTNASGRATFTNLAIAGAVGTYNLVFSEQSLSSATSTNISLTSGPASSMSISAGQGQTVVAGSMVPILPAVLVKDAGGNPVAGIDVLFTAVTQGSFIDDVLTKTITTNAQGIAQAQSFWMVSPTAGPNTLTASATGITGSPLTFTATGFAGPPSGLTFTTQPPTTATSGVALSPQPTIHLVDVNGNAAGGAGVVITAVISSGTGTVTNATATTVSSGLASFSGLAITGSGAFTLEFQSGTLTPVTSQPITLTAGSAANIVFGVQPTGGTGGVNLSPALTVRLVDAGGSTVINNTNTVSLAIAGGTGTPGATLSGAGPITFVNGVATFAATSIDFGGTGYALRATTNALNGAGGPIPFTTSNAFNLQPGTTQLLTTKAGTRVSVAAVGTTNPPGVTRPVFIAKNAQGTPTPGLTVSVTAFGRCRLDNGTALFTTLSFTSDANGEVTPLVRLPTTVNGSGCLIKASGPTFTTSTDSSQIAVFPALTSHVWTGAASNVWTNGANWIPVISVPNVPGSTSDNVFIPNYNPGSLSFIPVVSGPKPSMNRLSLDSLAFLDLGKGGIDIGGGGVTGFGFADSGSVHIQATANVSGLFDVLDMGQTGSCGAAAPMQAHLVKVSANVLNVQCHTFVDTAVVVTVNVIPNAGQGWLQLANSTSGLTVSGNANFTGDSLWVVNGVIGVTGTTTLGGGVSWSGGTLSASANTIFRSDHAFYSNAQIIVAGNAVFGGVGAGQQQFAGGTLTLLGNFSQNLGTVAGQTGQTFVTSSDHATNFFGSTAQTIAFATPTTSSFSVLRTQNSSAAGVQFTTNAQIVNGTVQPRVEIFQGRLQVNSGATFSVSSGQFVFHPGTNLNLLGNITAVGLCSGLSNGATITGTGTYTGATCTP